MIFDDELEKFIKFFEQDPDAPPIVKLLSANTQEVVHRESENERRVAAKTQGVGKSDIVNSETDLPIDVESD